MQILRPPCEGGTGGGELARGAPSAAAAALPSPAGGGLVVPPSVGSLAEVIRILTFRTAWRQPKWVV